MHRGLLTLSGRVNFLFHQCLRKNFICVDYTNTKRIIFLKNKFQINYGVSVPKITWSHICVFPLQHPRESLFRQLLGSSGKTTDIAKHYFFDIMYNMLRLCFPVLLEGGFTNNFSLETRQKIKLSQYSWNKE